MGAARHKMMLCQVLGLVLSVAPGSAPAEERPAAPDQSAAGGIAERERGCLEWTDGCSVCLRRADGAFGCSVPGIACQPAAIVCRVPLVPRAGAEAQGREGPR